MKKLFLLLLLVPLLAGLFVAKEPEQPQQIEYLTGTINAESDYFTAILIVEDGWLVSLEVCDKFEGESEIGDEPNHAEYERYTLADYDLIKNELTLFLEIMDALHEELEGY